MGGKKYFFVSAKMALENKVFTYILVYNMMRFFFRFTSLNSKF